MKATITLVLITFAAVSSVRAQSVYEAYFFSLFAGSPGVLGSSDGNADAAAFNAPQGVAADSAGNIYVADTGNNTVRKISVGGQVTTLAGLAGQDGTADGQGNAARFELPQGIAVDGGGDVYVSDTLNNTVRKITPDGNVTTLAGLPGTYGSTDGAGSIARFNYPLGLAVDGFGNIYVGDNGNNTIRKITPSGVVSTLAGSAGHPGYADGNGPSAQFCSPRGVALDGMGNLFVADTCNSTIRKITPAGLVSTVAGMAGDPGSTDGIGNSARFNGPRAVAVDAAGNIYVADSGNNIIRRIDSAANVTTLGGLAGNAGSADGVGNASRFNFPHAITAEAGGRLYVADTINETIRTAGPGPAHLVLVISSVSNALDQLIGNGPPNSQIVLSAAPDLTSAYGPITTVTTDAQGVYRYHDPNTYLRRFYRASFSAAP